MNQIQLMLDSSFETFFQDIQRLLGKEKSLKIAKMAFESFVSYEKRIAIQSKSLVWFFKLTKLFKAIVFYMKRQNSMFLSLHAVEYSKWPWNEGSCLSDNILVQIRAQLKYQIKSYKWKALVHQKKCPVSEW